MLPTSGYFKNIQCPFFKNGLCERYHCHFGHIKSASSSGRPLFGRSFPDTTKDYVDILDRAEIQQSTGIEQTLLSDHDVTYEKENVDVGVDYIPTPVSKCLPKAPSILKTSKAGKNTQFAVPEYRPTPISRLKSHSAPDTSEDNSVESSNISALSKKRKKVEEYDPTEVTVKKKVSFILPEDEKDDGSVSENEVDINSNVACVIIDSSDDDLDVTPQFSDDDYEEGHADSDVDDACTPDIEIRMEKPSINFHSDQTRGAFAAIISEYKRQPFETNRTEDTFLTGTSEYKLYSSDVSDSLPVDEIPAAIEKSDAAKNVHKPSSKTTSTRVDSNVKIQKSHRSEVKRPQNSNSSGKNLSDKPKKLKQEPCSDSVSHSALKTEKLHKDSSKLNVYKKENSSKNTTVSKPKNKGPPSGSNKSSAGVLPEKVNKSRHQNDIMSTLEMRSDEIRSKLQKSKLKSDSSEVDRKDRIATKHNDSLKSKISSKSLEKDSRTVSKNKSNPHDSDQDRLIKSKDIKIQDEKVSSSCQSSHKKPVASAKNRSSSPTKKKVKLKNDEKTAVKTKPSSAAHVSSRNSVCSKLVMKNSDKEIQCNVQGPLPEESDVKSISYTVIDSDDDVHLPASDSDMDSDTLEECLRIFNEHEQSQAQKKVSVEEVQDDKKENLTAQVKKRVAHQMAVSKPKVPKLQPQVNPSQVLHNRYLKLQDMYTHQNASGERKVPSAFANSASKGFETYKRHITVAPSAGLVAAVTQKQKLLQSSGGRSSMPQKSSASSDEITYVVTETKRVARVPSQVLKPRPIIPVEYGSKVPSNVRQRYLNYFIDECLKFCPDEEEAYQTALDEEKRAYERSSNKTIYLSVAVNVLKRLRNQATEAHSTSTSAMSDKSSAEQAASDAKMKSKTISHEMMLGGARAQKTSFSIEKKKPKMQDVEIKGNKLYELLMTYVLSSEQLVENGYPLPHPAEPGRALVSGIYVTKRRVPNDPFKRVCVRCQKTYQIDENGEYIKNEECEYHWGHLWQKRIGRSMERQYSCCGGDSQSDGCCLSPGHVFDGKESEILKGFVKTMPKTPPPDGYYGVYALDCEMCYTTGGIELIRVTVINPDMKPVYETYVKPENKILDFNTRFSGITEEHLKDVDTSLRDVQAVLLCLFNSKTILIGHSLESDFKALKLIHTTVVDTSVVFPHKRGLPYKRALRTLMAECVRKIIQNSLDGHDSNEDAVACMELMLWKIKEDMKRPR